VSYHLTSEARDLIARIIANPTLEAVTAPAPLYSDAYRRGQWEVVSYIANSRSNPAHYRKADQLRHDLNELHNIRERFIEKQFGYSFVEAERLGREQVVEWIDAFSATMTPEEAITLALEEQGVEQRDAA
jgi:hypothetical protein